MISTLCKYFNRQLHANDLHIFSSPEVCSGWSVVITFCVVFVSLNISNAYSLKPLSHFCLNFIWSLLWLGEWKIAKMVMVRWPRLPPCWYMVETCQNLPLQNSGSLDAESLQKSSGTWGLSKLLKWWLYMYIDVWPFYGEVKFASLWICNLAPYIWEKCWEFQTISEAARPMLLRFHVEPFFWVWERKIAKMVAAHWPRWPPFPYMVKTYKNPH